MLPESLDMLIAFKVIALDERLSSSQKRVAIAIVDSFNRKTGQCDPSLDRIAHLLGTSQRTVSRAVKRIERLRIIGKLRHGGKFNRNSYTPNWGEFRAAEARWRARKKTRHWERSSQIMSPTACQSCPTNGDKSVYQTSISNNFPSTSRESSRAQAPKQAVRSKSSKQAAYDAAERRWLTAFDERFRGSPVYAALLDAMSPELCGKATEAEMIRTGTGLRSILASLGVEYFLDMLPAMPREGGG